MLDSFFRRGEFPANFEVEGVGQSLDDKLEELKKTKVIAIDELDFINSKDQSVLYNIFDWPHFKKVPIAF